MSAMKTCSTRRSGRGFRMTEQLNTESSGPAPLLLPILFEPLDHVAALWSKRSPGVLAAPSKFQHKRVDARTDPIDGLQELLGRELALGVDQQPGVIDPVPP